MQAPAGVQATVFSKGNRWIVHLINGVGERPLCDNVPLYGLSFRLRTERPVAGIRALIDDVPVEFFWENGVVCVKIERLEVWNAFEILCEEGGVYI